VGWIGWDQDYIHTLEQSLQEEMTRHSPLYGVGVERMSAEQLDVLARIHQQGLQKVQQCFFALQDAASHHHQHHHRQHTVAGELDSYDHLRGGAGTSQHGDFNGVGSMDDPPPWSSFGRR
jgi:hypothetical protein